MMAVTKLGAERITMVTTTASTEDGERGHGDDDGAAGNDAEDRGLW